jgi:hypothetical protein
LDFGLTPPNKCGVACEFRLALAKRTQRSEYFGLILP